MASRLLSLGAMQQTPLIERRMCPIKKTTRNGFVGMIRVGGCRGHGGVGPGPVQRQLLSPGETASAAVDGERRRKGDNGG